MPDIHHNIFLHHCSDITAYCHQTNSSGRGFDAILRFRYVFANNAYKRIYHRQYSRFLFRRKKDKNTQLRFTDNRTSRFVDIDIQIQHLLYTSQRSVGFYIRSIHTIIICKQRIYNQVCQYENPRVSGRNKLQYLYLAVCVCYTVGRKLGQNQCYVFLSVPNIANHRGSS